MRSWYDRGGRERVREYQRERFGYPPARVFNCLDCGRPARSYLDGDHCSACRTKQARYESRPPIRRLACVACGKPVDVPRRARGSIGGGPSHIACTECRYQLRSATNRRKYIKRRRGVVPGVRYTLAEIGDRDGWRCHLCSRRVDRERRFPHRQSPTIDHLIPIADGGLDAPVNVALAHLVCNVRRSRGGTVQLRALA